MKVTPIVNGTVIDHIPAGRGIIVLDILELPDIEQGSVVSALMNVPSKHAGRKDIIKIEDRILKHTELEVISLIAPDATINIIRDTKVEEKYRIDLPTQVSGIVKCGNPNCISNQKEPVEPSFSVETKNPVMLRCDFCERKLSDISKNIIR